MNKYDFLIIGGGIVGTSTAWQLQQRYQNKKILLLEKEPSVGQHQTGHNSGVIHAGVYYEPGSLKAEFCKRGAAATISFCKENDIAYEQCGKLLIATNDVEHARMLALYDRCQQKEIAAELLTTGSLKQREPNISGTGAIFIEATGIVDYVQINKKILDSYQALGGEVRLDEKVVGLEENDECVKVITNQDTYQSSYLVVCAGLMADRLAQMHGLKTDFRIIPFRGEYYKLPDQKKNLINHLIYPIPDPEMPFLGVHLTRMAGGGITVGPNAVLGWKREGYGKINIDVNDIYQMVTYAGFWRVILNNFTYGLGEMKNSLFKSAYLKQVQKYCPQIGLNDLEPYPAGVRAQAVLNDGTLVHDFLFVESKRSLHVANAPSPAATSAIPIGEYLCNKISEKVNYNKI